MCHQQWNPDTEEAWFAEPEREPDSMLDPAAIERLKAHYHKCLLDPHEDAQPFIDAAPALIFAAEWLPRLIEFARCAEHFGAIDKERESAAALLAALDAARPAPSTGSGQGAKP